MQYTHHWYGVFSKDSLLLKNFSNSRFYHGIGQIKGYQCNIASRLPLWKPLTNAIRRFLSVYYGHFLGSYNPIHSRSVNSSVVTTTFGTLTATSHTTTISITITTTISTTTMYDMEYNDDRSLLKH